MRQTFSDIRREYSDCVQADRSAGKNIQGGIKAPDLVVFGSRTIYKHGKHGSNPIGSAALRPSRLRRRCCLQVILGRSCCQEQGHSGQLFELRSHPSHGGQLLHHHRAACAQELRNIQSYHMDSLGWSDIGYNFLIGGDGAVYEGRGWNVVGAHATNWNSKSIGISFLGNYNYNTATSAMISAAKGILADAVSRGQIVSGYTLYGHRQVSATECPGTTLWNEIRGWSNWKA